MRPQISSGWEVVYVKVNVHSRQPAISLKRGRVDPKSLLTARGIIRTSYRLQRWLRSRNNGNAGAIGWTPWSAENASPRRLPQQGPGSTAGKFCQFENFVGCINCISARSYPALNILTISGKQRERHSHAFCRQMTADRLLTLNSCCIVRSPDRHLGIHDIITFHCFDTAAAATTVVN